MILSEAPEGYTWELSEDADPMFAGLDGKTLSLVLFKNGSVVERRGVFVPTNREDETPAFVKGMEESIRLSLK